MAPCLNLDPSTMTEVKNWHPLNGSFCNFRLGIAVNLSYLGSCQWENDKNFLRAGKARTQYSFLASGSKTLFSPRDAIGKNAFSSHREWKIRFYPWEQKNNILERIPVTSNQCAIWAILFLLPWLKLYCWMVESSDRAINLFPRKNAEKTIIFLFKKKTRLDSIKL